MAVNQYSLITLDNVVKFIGQDSFNSDDSDLIEDLINRVSSLFESYMDRNILTREYTEYHDGGGNAVLFPKQPKITTISGIWDDYDWDYADDDLVDADDYKIVDELYVVLKNTTFNNYTQNIKIIYTAGYTSTPEDIAQACITEVSRMFSNRLKVDVTAQTLADGSVSFTSKELLPQTKLVLNTYKRMSIV